MENITVFAPNNDAFAAIGSLLGDLSMDELGGILQYHVVEGTVGYSSGLMNGTLMAANGEELNVMMMGEDVYVDSARVVIPDVLIANGVLHVIDRLVPPSTPFRPTHTNISF